MALFRSLRARVVFWVSVALTVLFAITIAGLDVAFRRSTERAVQDLLQAQFLGLLALAEETPEHELALAADAVINPLFSAAGSGLYGMVWDAAGRPIWRSASLLGSSLPVPRRPAPSERYDISVSEPGLPPLRAHFEGISWQFSDGSSRPYTVAVAVSLTPYEAQQAAFRRNLIGWFAGITLTMLAVLAGVLTFVLRPLRHLEREVRDVEAGRRERLSGGLPAELIGLARSLNALIDTERRRLARYRNTLDDLAHSLKTPLAAIRTLLSDRDAAGGRVAESLDREVERMDQRITYQLRRARASGATGLGAKPIAAEPLIVDIVETLDKVYRTKQVRCELDLVPGISFYGDPGDFSEVMGNVIENAYKYCRHNVIVSGRSVEQGIELEVEDDGPGIDPDSVTAVLQRGVRADESVPGQGIGLAVVQETVALYNGELDFLRAADGGTRVRVLLRRPGFGG